MSDIDTKQLYNQLGINKPQQTDKKANDELGQAEFLELMTSQLKFQDPLEPMENGDFLAQMAQFGTVNGINELNSAFSNMSAAFQSNQALQASTMVGRNVMLPGTQGQLADTGSLHAAVDLQQPANRVVVNITDANGQLVHRMETGLQQAGLMEFDWNGLNANGDRVSPGRYTLAAEIHRGENISAGDVLVTAAVESVTLGQAGQDLTLSVAGLGDISISQIRKIM